MAKSYTIRIREPGSSWCYVDGDLRIVHDAAHCKPLTLAQARKARRLMIDGAAKQGRPVECELVTLGEPAGRLIVLEKTLARYLGGGE